jgi:hypothetical protein
MRPAAPAKDCPHLLPDGPRGQQTSSQDGQHAGSESVRVLGPERQAAEHHLGSCEAVRTKPLSGRGWPGRRPVEGGSALCAALTFHNSCSSRPRRKTDRIGEECSRKHRRSLVSGLALRMVKPRKGGTQGGSLSTFSAILLRDRSRGPRRSLHRLRARGHLTTSSRSGPRADTGGPKRTDTTLASRQTCRVATTPSGCIRRGNAGPFRSRQAG